jgi:hypothetical protein
VTAQTKEIGMKIILKPEAIAYMEKRGLLYWATSCIAYRGTEMVHSIQLTAARSSAEARGYMYEQLEEEFSPADGWDINIAVVSAYGIAPAGLEEGD